MTDQELADAVVALGVGALWGENFPGRYRLGITDAFSVDDYAFVRDWRVAGALMEKVPRAAGEDPLLLVMARAITSREDSLPRAITEACIGALSDDDKTECTHPNLKMTEFGDYCEDCGWEDDFTGSNEMGG